MLLWSRPSTLSMTPGRTRFGGARKVFLGLLALTAAACAKQGEGERCDALSGSADCDDGLTCIPLDQLLDGADGAICCSDNPSVNICRGEIFNLPGDGGTTPPETPASDAGTSSLTLTSSDADGSSNTSSANTDDAASSITTDASAEAGVASSETSQTTEEALTSSSAPASSGPSVSSDSTTTDSTDSADAAVPDSGP
jgi:hypothetical protein